MNAVMPTAYVINTGYWVYYSSSNRTPLCVCRRFGLHCTHKSNATHWLNLETSPEIRLTPLSANVTGKYIPVDFNVKVVPVASDILRSYDVSLRMMVEEFQKQNVPGALQVPNRYLINAELRYLFSPEFYPHDGRPVNFSPHPLAHIFYGKYLPTLSTYRDTIDSQFHTHFRNTLVLSMLPSMSIVPYGPTTGVDNSYAPSRRRNPFRLHVYNEMRFWFEKGGADENARKRSKVPRKVAQAYAETHRRCAPVHEENVQFEPKPRTKKAEIRNTAVQNDSKLFLETGFGVNPSTTTAASNSTYDDSTRFFRDGGLNAEEVEKYFNQTEQNASNTEHAFSGFDYSFSDVINNLLANSF
ncbi:uncharacterized protein LOC116178229 [Photinus pyralis]|uniref:uncharacterized protein LOC116178229 n=1 Tax=Photinus pyralis TaxID=7054 RepID=UPI001266E746|nr:uncharacterized protein LOC116178229 [Photinus pyralis]